jgi:hypothetical protein
MSRLCSISREKAIYIFSLECDERLCQKGGGQHVRNGNTDFAKFID